jgi:hypothetical protein
MLLIPLIILAFCLARFAKATGRKVSPVLIWVLSILLPFGCVTAVNVIWSTPTQPAWPYNIIAYLVAIVAVVLFVVLASKKNESDAETLPDTALEPIAAAPSVSAAPSNPKVSGEPGSTPSGGR